MSDFDLIKLCAEAMGFSVVKGDARYKNGMAIATEDGDPVVNYDPLKHDAQAMALVKKLNLQIERSGTLFEPKWYVDSDSGPHVIHEDLNRAIVECAASTRRADRSEANGH